MMRLVTADGTVVLEAAGPVGVYLKLHVLVWEGSASPTFLKSMVFGFQGAGVRSFHQCGFVLRDLA